MNKITAGQVAAELRKLADALDKEPERECYAPLVNFYCATKAEFLTAALAMPRPFKKTVEEGRFARIQLEYHSDVIWVHTSVPQHLTCELVEPAKPAVYRCDPILSAIEEAELEAAS